MTTKTYKTFCETQPCHMYDTCMPHVCMKIERMCIVALQDTRYVHTYCPFVECGRLTFIKSILRVLKLSIFDVTYIKSILRFSKIEMF
jgi:hypothetical protein